MVLLLGVFPFSALAADEIQETAPDSQSVTAEELPEEAPGDSTEGAMSPTEAELPTETEPDTSTEETAATTEGAEAPEATEAAPVETEAPEVTEPEETEISVTEPEETEIPATEPVAAPMKAQARATNGLYTWQDHILNQDKYYTFDNGMVEGFNFTLLRDDIEVETVSTGASGVAVFHANLTPGATYTVRETQVRGYEVQPDQTFTAESGKTHEIWHEYPGRF